MVANPEEMTSTDPDGYGCYSSHAEDIFKHGECAMCTSTDPEIVGHVLPDTPRLKGVGPIDACRQVVERQTAMFVDGVLLDHFSASTVVQVHDALNSENQQRLASWPLVKVVDSCFRLTQPRR